MATYKLAELLLRRKELQEQVKRMNQINLKDLYEVKMQRRQVSETLDDINATVPKITYAEFSAEYNFYAHQLRLVDAAIQQANWTTDVDTPEDVMSNFKAE